MEKSKKNYLVTVLLAWFLGTLGVHRFYTGHIAYGIIQLITGGGCGIWTLIDFINLCFGNYRDADGLELADYNPTTGKTIFFIWLGLIVLSMVFYFLMFTVGLMGALES